MKACGTDRWSITGNRLYVGMVGALLTGSFGLGVGKSARAFDDIPTHKSFDALEVEECQKEVHNSFKTHSNRLTNEWEQIKFSVRFDCKEASLIEKTDQPVKTSEAVANFVRGGLSLFSFGPGRTLMRKMIPYCRKDNLLYGEFCMGADIAATHQLLRQPKLIKTLPEAIERINGALSSNEKIDFVRVLRPLYSDPQDLVLVAGFLGLDDNGVQTDRLKALLLHTKNFKLYSHIFRALDQYSPIGMDSSRGHLQRLLFSTRTGAAMVPGLGEDATQTYKAYAGLFLGCEVAKNPRHKLRDLKSVGFFGWSYQIIKWPGSWPQGPSASWKNLQSLDKHGQKTANLMQKGAEYGFKTCRQKNREW